MKRTGYVLAMCLALLPALVHAQDFGVVESAETIQQGNFKVRANPIAVFQDDDNEPGIAGAFGYGLTDRFDVEGKLALYDNLTLVGGDAEYWLVKRPQPVDVSVSAGAHFANSEFGDQTGLDLTLLASHAVTRRFDIYGAIDMAFRRYVDPIPDRTYTQVHLVPGLEYKIRQDIDVVAEFGVALNDDSSHYISAGLAYYLR